MKKLHTNLGVLVVLAIVAICSATDRATVPRHLELILDIQQ